MVIWIIGEINIYKIVLFDNENTWKIYSVFEKKLKVMILRF